MAEEQTDNRTLGITFLIAGIGLAISLGVAIGPVFMPAGAALVIVGFTFLVKAKAEDSE